MEGYHSEGGGAENAECRTIHTGVAGVRVEGFPTTSSLFGYLINIYQSETVLELLLLKSTVPNCWILGPFG